MKKPLILSLVLMTISGCQSFKYYDPAKPHHGKKHFLNNYDNSPKGSFWKWQWERLTTDHPAEPPFTPEVVKTDVTALRSNQKKNTLTWIGHSSVLLQVSGLNILVDPVFSERVSPMSFAGPQRLVPLPFQLSELPPIDVVLISHSHYDHLDLPTLRALEAREPGRILYLVPLGDRELLTAEGLNQVQEFDWWENTVFRKLKFTFTPSQHWSSRTPFDDNLTLWGGWHIASSSGLRVLYTGDTGYSKDFRDIRARLGAVDLLLAPIGAYEPKWFMKRHHVDPADAVQIAIDMNAKLSIGVHWGTFRLSDEPMTKPPEDLSAALKDLPGVRFLVMKHGETREL